MVRICFDSDLLVATVQDATRQSRARNAVWRPEVPHRIPAEFWSLCLSHGAVGLAASTIADALPLAVDGTRTILVCLPPALSQVTLIAGFPKSTELLLTIDHFVQAERIAAQVMGLETDQPVVVLLHGGKPGPGIRPGQDALLLAQGVNQLPGIRVVGISASITQECDSETIVKSMAHAQKQFRESGISCDFVSVAASVDAIPLDNTVVTEIRDQTALQIQKREQPLVWLEAEVISRPSLKHAVLNVPQAWFPPEVTTWLPDFPATKISHRLENCCVISTTGEAHRLMIGDVVRMATGNPYDAV